jgi:cardiolipin synthase
MAAPTSPDSPIIEVAHEMARIFWRDAVTPHWGAALGASLALYVFSRQLSERRPPGNIMAWGMLMLIAPIPGLILFMLFGARKRAEMGRIRLAVARAAGLLRENEARPPGGPDTEPTMGNRVRLLADPAGTATFLTMREQIAGASTSIHILTYIFGDDSTGREIIRLLAARARDGVKVRLLVDALGSRSAGDTLFRELTDAGGEYAWFMPVAPWKARSSANLRNHRKLAVFDGSRAIVGGQNLAAEYTGPTPLPGRYRDFGALIEGPAAAEFGRLFAADWCFATGEEPELLRYDLVVKPEPVGSTSVEVVGGGPDFRNDPIWEKLVTLAADCRRELVIVTPYLVPDEVLLRLIAAKARAGRRVKIITPKKSDHRFLDFARRHHLKILRDAGARVFFHEKGMLHGKLFIVDREVVVIGSANLDMRSLFVNFELATVVSDRAVAAEALRLAETLESECKPAGPPRNKAVSYKERTLENLAHLLAPLL